MENQFMLIFPLAIPPPYCSPPFAVGEASWESSVIAVVLGNRNMYLAYILDSKDKNDTLES